MISRKKHGYSLIETMAVIGVIAIVVGLLYAYSDEGWKLFYQSYSRGLSQVKAKIAIRALQEELREANKNRLLVGKGTAFGVPLPDDTKEGASFIYFTKPKTFEQTGDVIGYDYILYYFAKPKELFYEKLQNVRQRTDIEKPLTLKTVKFINQSKYYTEDSDKNWPFLPPILELNKSTLEEDEVFINSLKESSEAAETSTIQIKTSNEQEIFLDHFARLKKESRNIPISGNFQATTLTDPFASEDVNFFFGQSYKGSKPVKIKVTIQESPILFGLMSAKTEFEVKVTPRN